MKSSASTPCNIEKIKVYPTMYTEGAELPNLYFTVFLDC